jgi:type II secretory pathway pseudopilin PulG
MKFMRGFTLIESLFSIMFVICAAAIAVAAMPVSTTSKTKAKYYNFAVNFATRQIEEIQYHSFAKITPDDLAADQLIDNTVPVSGTDTYACDNTQFGGGDAITSKLPNGKATVRIEILNADMKRVTVHVEWKERTNIRTYDVAAVVADL